MTVREGIVNMNEAAFGAFNVVKGKRVWHTAESKAIWTVKRSRVECNDSVPAALHRYRMT